MKVEIRTKIWLEVEGHPFCHGKAALLSAIQQHGSIRQAARQLRMSYRRAWEYIRDLEASLQFTVVDTQAGGTRGGGAHLTPRGIALLDTYQAVHERVAEAVSTHGATAI
ncbi:MAG: LysR family transcriptional regulator [Candidatus Latescibacteria bacterium]|nr:LysR family transcriptional regulator [Candidatus Latescibacterota bacterium]